MTRTSLTHPLKIDSFPLANGRLGMTLAPGRCGPSSNGPDWARDLDTDVAALRAWGAQGVITLQPMVEMRRVRNDELGAALQSAGIDWLHLPFPDAGVPDPAWWENWTAVSPHLHRGLEAGHNLVIHCRAGLERTAMVALLLQVERGASEAEALAIIAGTRPDARPLPGQIRAVRDRVPPLTPRAARIRAMLMGGALGDAMGAEIEFWSLDRIRRRFPAGIDRLLPHQGLTGAITDDTQMTLFAAEGLVRALDRGTPALEELHRAWLRWLTKQGEAAPVTLERAEPGLWHDPRLQARRAPGTTCLSALRATRAPGTPARNDSKGCGGVMRLSPLVLIEPFDAGLAAASSALTHGHPTATAAAVAWASLLRAAVVGRDLAETAAYLAETVEPACARSLRAALTAPRDGRPETVETLGGGWVAEEAVAISLYAALSARDLEQGLQIALTHSGDSDSTAAMAGSLLGLINPDQVTNHLLTRHVECADLIRRLAADLDRVTGSVHREERESTRACTTPSRARGSF